MPPTSLLVEQWVLRRAVTAWRRGGEEKAEDSSARTSSGRCPFIHAQIISLDVITLVSSPAFAFLPAAQVHVEADVPSNLHGMGAE